MKTCLNCQNFFESIKSHTKYCSHKCCLVSQHKKLMWRRKHDPVVKEKYRISENKRKKRKRLSDPSFREKHNLEERKRYRLKHGIINDSDLKCAPKGSGTITKHGYKQITNKNHPNANRGGTMFEHVFVMSEHLKRPLIKGENVHHINGIRNDNRIENLELWSCSQPSGQRVVDKIKWCKEFLEQYDSVDIIGIKDKEPVKA